MKNIGLVISENHQRFSRVKSLLLKFNIIAIHLPAVFINNSIDCQGTNGHRLAMRNAWNMITHSNISMGVFEDDIQMISHNSIHLFQNAIHLHNTKHNDMTFIEDASGFYRNAAIYISPFGASQLLNKSEKCIRTYGHGIDSEIHGKVCKVVKCKRFKGIFYQDRKNVKPYLHDDKNKYIG